MPHWSYMIILVLARLFLNYFFFALGTTLPRDLTQICLKLSAGTTSQPFASGDKIALETQRELKR